MAYCRPAVLTVITLMAFSLASSGSKSGGTISIMSISPLISAFTWVCWSTMVIHSTRSTLATLPPLRPLGGRSEEHTSELQSQSNLVCRLLLEKKKKKKIQLYMLTNDNIYIDKD